MSNAVLDEPLNLMIYCYREEHGTLMVTVSLSAHQYLHQDGLTDWADSAAVHMPNRHYQAPDVMP